jgi:hypothetical protein
MLNWRHSVAAGSPPRVKGFLVENPRRRAAVCCGGCAIDGALVSRIGYFEGPVTKKKAPWEVSMRYFPIPRLFRRRAESSTPVSRRLPIAV